MHTLLVAPPPLPPPFTLVDINMIYMTNAPSNWLFNPAYSAGRDENWMVGRPGGNEAALT